MDTGINLNYKLMLNAKSNALTLFAISKILYHQIVLVTNPDLGTKPPLSLFLDCKQTSKTFNELLI